MAKNAAKNAVAAAKQNTAKQNTAPAQTPAAAPTDKERREAAVKAGEALVGKTCKVIGGRKFKDATVIVGWGGANKYFSTIVRAETAPDQPVQFFDAKHLEVVGDAKKADADRVIKRITDERDATLYIAAEVSQESDKAVQIKYAGWFKRVWFTKEMVTNTGAEAPNGFAIFEIPEWKVRAECGGDSVDALKAKQADLEKIVNAA